MILDISGHRHWDGSRVHPRARQSIYSRRTPIEVTLTKGAQHGWGVGVLHRKDMLLECNCGQVTVLFPSKPAENVLGCPVA